MNEPNPLLSYEVNVDYTVPKFGGQKKLAETAPSLGAQLFPHRLGFAWRCCLSWHEFRHDSEKLL